MNMQRPALSLANSRTLCLRPDPLSRPRPRRHLHWKLPKHRPHPVLPAHTRPGHAPLTGALRPRQQPKDLRQEDNGEQPGQGLHVPARAASGVIDNARGVRRGPGLVPGWGSRGRKRWAGQGREIRECCTQESVGGAWSLKSGLWACPGVWAGHGRAPSCGWRLA